ncbi:hypothetical protein CD33_13255 [Ureibacillus sinduriensis BLB-1 = JCM 15800]|uniref:Secreted protein n=1 Tax=Ureibacillus sinduriensis BLB-1 = JCM 15800 TaxID=1384057 RepID=A0A0A3HQT4_9BACL|nr:hypothetical protein CD33_13255 [Ureibacillus sinduriensis BLB-1 = JCM 15800]
MIKLNLFLLITKKKHFAMILLLQLAAYSWAKSMNLDNNVKSLEHRRDVKSIGTVLESDCAFLFKLAKESPLLFHKSGAIRYCTPKVSFLL